MSFIEISVAHQSNAEETFLSDSQCNRNMYACCDKKFVIITLVMLMLVSLLLVMYMKKT